MQLKTVPPIPTAPLPQGMDKISPTRAQALEAHHHPGYYFQTAATMMRARRHAYRQTRLLFDDHVIEAASDNGDDFDFIWGHGRRYVGEAMLGSEGPSASSDAICTLLKAEAGCAPLRWPCCDQLQRAPRQGVP